MKAEEIRDRGIGVRRLGVFIVIGIIYITRAAIEAVELLYKLVYYRIV